MDAPQRQGLELLLRRLLGMRRQPAVLSLLHYAWPSACRPGYPGAWQDLQHHGGLFYYYDEHTFSTLAQVVTVVVFFGGGAGGPLQGPAGQHMQSWHVPGCQLSITDCNCPVLPGETPAPAPCTATVLRLPRTVGPRCGLPPHGGQCQRLPRGQGVAGAALTASHR